MQTIAMPDAALRPLPRGRDWIQTYIFPGGHLPVAGGDGRARCARSSGLLVQALEDIGPHYAETLRLWRERFLRDRDAVRALGYDERFVRTWDFYLAFCEAAFRERMLRDVQVVLARPGR